MSCRCEAPAHSYAVHVRDMDVSESGECPHRGREAATLGQSGVLPLDLWQPGGSRLS
ncbi:hypothetical protein [Nitrospira moscoviensis]|uniref:Uncharacterized protein n=1 Tax=Nitrospira moscoviensis TaxID=42253 RepID=A0A0K2GEU5_NITMO|nr:hypothetical protein [Nitrospira moscoviensis]ALA59473.1 hypothetical protein NITMOv2_3074 [Nitrospira moscoviensis]